MSVSKTVDVKVPKKSGFDKSFRNLLTAPVGTLVPLLCDEVIPNSSVHLDVAANASLAPLASDCFMNCDLALEAFFVPTRTLYGGYTKWMTGEEVWNSSGSNYKAAGLPRVAVRLYSGDTTQAAYLGPGSLADYLGIKATTADVNYLKTGTTTGYTFYNIFPFLAYHKTVNDWYRNSLVERPWFQECLNNADSGLTFLPHRTLSGVTNYSLVTAFSDGTKLGETRQRNFGTDYFTNATPEAQNGNPQSVTFSTTGSTGSVTISSLRAANSLQQYLERNNLAGFQWQDYLHANFGANLSDGVAQRTVYLGSGKIPVYTKGIYQNSPAQSGGGSVVPNNPMFSTVGAEYGSVSCNGQVTLVENFTANEPGYIMVMMSLVPKATYGTGVLRQNMRYTTSAGTQTDLANPLLQNTGNQPIYRGELNFCDNQEQNGAVFGYTDRYADFMTREDELHGLLRDGETLQSFALQRNFVHGRASIDSAFLKIPKTYMDQVAASTAGVSGYGVWVDSYLNYKVAMPLAKYSIPSLQDPAYEHGEDVTVRRGGSRID